MKTITFKDIIIGIAIKQNQTQKVCIEHLYVTSSKHGDDIKLSGYV
jgi:hypothetical protein